MSDDDKRERFSLRRWSSRKRAATAVAATADPPDAVAPIDAPAVTSSEAAVSPASVDGSQGIVTTEVSGASAPALPPIDSLTPDSDFAPFMQPSVDPALKRGALRKLFADPRYNVMDGLDVYIDDYSKPDPIAPDVLAKLAHARYIFSPPATRMNAQGFVEDVPVEEASAAPGDAASAEAPPAVPSSDKTNDGQ